MRLLLLSVVSDDLLIFNFLGLFNLLLFFCFGIVSTEKDHFGLTSDINRCLIFTFLLIHSIDILRVVIVIIFPLIVRLIVRLDDFNPVVFIIVVIFRITVPLELHHVWNLVICILFIRSKRVFILKFCFCIVVNDAILRLDFLCLFFITVMLLIIVAFREKALDFGCKAHEAKLNLCSLLLNFNLFDAF